MDIPRSKKSTGATTLELAIAFISLITFIIGGVEITAVLRAHTALREGVHQALRCLVTTEGECVGTSPIDNREAIYRVYDVHGGIKRLVSTYQYDGATEELTVPTIEFGQFQAKILDKRISNAHLFQASRDLYEATGLVRYYVKSRPQVISKNNDGDLKNLKVLDENNKKLTTQLSSSPNAVVKDNGPGQNTYVTSAFSIPHQLDTSITQCFTDRLLPDERHRPQIIPTECNEAWANRTSEDIVIVIHGSAPPGREGSGAVNIQLETDESELPLGGRLFSQGAISQTADFVPRGVSGDLMDDDVKSRYPDETSQYQTVSVPLKKSFKLRFTVTSQSPSVPVSWRLESIDIFLPNYDEQEENIPCADLVSNRDKKNLSCPLSLELQKQMPKFRFSEIELGQFIKHEDRTLGCLASDGMARYLLDTTDKGRSQSFDLTRQGDRCEKIQYESTCPENKGVKDLEDPETHFIRSSSEAEALCPISPIATKFITDSTVEGWREKYISLMERPVGLSRHSCFEPFPEHGVIPPGLIPSLSSYPKIKATTQRETERAPFAPINSKATFEDMLNPEKNEFNCLNLLAQKGKPLSQRTDGGSDEFFKTSQPDLGCDWKEKVLHHAHVSNSIRITPIKSNARGRVEVITKEPPDSCTPYSPIPNSKQERIYLGKGTSSEVSILCKKAQGYCETVFDGWKGSLPSGTTDNIELARTKAFQTINALFPQSVSDVSNLVALSIDQENGHYIVSGSINVPRLLFSGSRTVSYKESTMREAEKVLYTLRE